MGEMADLDMEMFDERYRSFGLTDDERLRARNRGIDFGSVVEDAELTEKLDAYEERYRQLAAEEPQPEPVHPLDRPREPLSPVQATAVGVGGCECSCPLRGSEGAGPFVILRLPEAWEARTGELELRVGFRGLPVEALTHVLAMGLESVMRATGELKDGEAV